MTQAPTPICPARICIVEDDPEIVDILSDTLADYGYETFHYPSATTFLKAIDADKPDLCLIDLGLPDQNGLDLVRTLDGEHNIPVIIISGRRALTDRIVGLEMGADDYVAKPFEPAEIVARVRSVLRRTERSKASAISPSAEVAEFEGWKVDIANFTLTSPQGEDCPLSQAEMSILRVFLAAPNRLLSRAQILDEVDIDPDKNFDRSVDVRISRLRTKLAEDPQNPKLIKTVYGAGYLFVAQVNWR